MRQRRERGVRQNASIYSRGSAQSRSWSNGAKKGASELSRALLAEGFVPKSKIDKSSIFVGSFFGAAKVMARGNYYTDRKISTLYEAYYII